MNHGAVHAEVLARQHAAFMHRFHRRVEPVSQCVELDQAIPVLAKHRVIPRRDFDRQADEQRNRRLYEI